MRKRYKQQKNKRKEDKPLEQCNNQSTAINSDYTRITRRSEKRNREENKEETKGGKKRKNASIIQLIDIIDNLIIYMNFSVFIHMILIIFVVVFIYLISHLALDVSLGIMSTCFNIIIFLLSSISHLSSSMTSIFS